LKRNIYDKDVFVSVKRKNIFFYYLSRKFVNIYQEKN